MKGGRIWQTFLGVRYAEMLEYRAEIILWALAMPLPFIMMGLWVEAAGAGEFALSPVEFVRYFIGVFLVRQLTVVWVIWEFEREVVQGSLSFRLLLPIDPVVSHIASHVSERLARWPIIAALLGLFFVLYPEAMWMPSLKDIGLFSLLTLGAFALRFLIQYTFALLSFWVERASAIDGFWTLFYGFLSGLIAPLEVFPEAVARVAFYTPFPYLVHVPARVLMGAPVDWAQALGVMAAWGAVFFILNRVLWAWGLRRYSGMGA